MAKISYTKLSLSKEKLSEVKTVTFNEQEIEVKQYLPINQKLELISRVINKSADENNFANPVKLEVFMILEMIYAYTNISFTEKQKEDEIKLFDMIVANGLWRICADAIPEFERAKIFTSTIECAEAVYKYRNSVLGILESIGQDYSTMDLDVTAIQQKLSDPENMALLKNVLTKLG